VTIKSFHNALHRAAQFHESPKFIGWLKDRFAIVYLTAERRRTILFYGAFIAGAIALFRRNAKWREYSEPANWLAPLIDFPVLLGLLYLVYLAACRWQKLPPFIRRYPQLPLHLLFWAVLVVLWLTPQDAGRWRSVLTLFAFSLPYLLWRCGYLILSAQRNKVSASRFRDHLFYLWPVWGGTNTPYGKGLDYLSKCEAKTPEAFAGSILAGVKLLLLSLIWEGAEGLLDAAVYGAAKSPLLRLWGGYGLGVPRLSAIVNGTVQVSLFTTWVSLYLELIRDTLDIAADGHQLIGLLRLFGFNVFRNTYKPLLAESIIEFWSRYYYYFKELMFEVFFFPTYLNYFRRHAKLRMFAAVFAAAFLGNSYYHVLQGKNALIAGEFAGLWHVLGPRLVYCFFLTIGIYLSMLHQQRQAERIETSNLGMARLRKFVRIAWVWTFFGFLTFWSLKTNLTLPEKSSFFFSLFGF